MKRPAQPLRIEIGDLESIDPLHPLEPMRQEIRETYSDLEDSDLMELQLAATEMMANFCKHGRGKKEGCLTIVPDDEGARLTAENPYEPDDDIGLDPELVRTKQEIDELLDEFGVSKDEVTDMLDENGRGQFIMSEGHGTESLDKWVEDGLYKACLRIKFGNSKSF